jgi:CheY-like chemotaxis protein
MAGLLLDGNLAHKERRFAETLRDAADNLLRLINDILDFSKLEANRLTLENISFSVEEVLDSVARLQEAKAAQKGLYLRTQIAADVPARLKGDPGRLRQVLLNLVDNGLKFTKQGGVEIRVGLGSLKDGRARLSFAVRDTGMGIAAEDQAGLFQQFAQVDSSTSRRFGGTGLGLAICRRLVEQMNGKITITSALGKGTTFTFDITLDVDETPQIAAVKSPVGEGLASAGRRLRVLLAEDNVTNRTVATYWLESLGHHVDAVSNGREAVEAVRNVPYDVVLMDVMMPEKDGLEATRDIRALPAPMCTVPVVAVTANALQQHMDVCRDAGMDDFLTKPIITTQLFALVQRVIDGNLRHRP